jgi:hypothetical protein
MIGVWYSPMCITVEIPTVPSGMKNVAAPIATAAVPPPAFEI